VNGTVVADQLGLITLKQLKLEGKSGGMRLKIVRAK